MSLRWLFGNFADPQYKLDKAEQRRLSDVAHERYMPSRTFFVWTLVALLIPVGLAFKVVLPVVLQWLDLDGSNSAYFVGIVVIIFLFWFWCAWVFRSLYVKPMRLAMRDAGYDVCVGCGYLLKGLEEKADKCPECGKEPGTEVRSH